MIETDQLTDGQLIDLPPEAGDVYKPRFEPDNTWLAGASRVQQKTAMWRWLATNYEEPDVATPHDADGYLFLDGGPFFTSTLLKDRFEGLVPDEIISEMICSVQAEVGDEWAAKPLDRFGG
jgi:hypothetical protein